MRKRRRRAPLATNLLCAILTIATITASAASLIKEKTEIDALNEKFWELRHTREKYESQFSMLVDELYGNGGWDALFEEKDNEEWFTLPKKYIRPPAGLEELRKAVRDENAAIYIIREKVLALDRYISFVKGIYTYNYLENVVVYRKADLFSRAVSVALSDPRYSPKVGEVWQGAGEDFLSAARVIEAIYNFVRANVSYASDNAQFNQLEFYIPPDVLLENIMNGHPARGDCEDQSILFMSLVWRAILDGELNISLEDVFVEEREMTIPRRLLLYIFDVFGEPILFFWRWDYVDVGHAFPVVLLPHPYGEGKIRIPIEVTHYLPDGQPAPWDTWVENGPTENMILEKYSLRVLDNVIPYPFVGRERYFYERLLLNKYGPRTFTRGPRPPFYIPQQNLRGRCVYGTLAGNWYDDRYSEFREKYGSCHPADWPEGVWQLFYLY